MGKYKDHFAAFNSKLQEALENLHEFRLEGEKLLEDLKILNQQIAERDRIEGEKIKKSEERFLRSKMKPDCELDCYNCSEKNSCEISKGRLKGPTLKKRKQRKLTST